jgi:prepilin-type N-terminal cleavage/methylation domain-containing protein
MTQQKNAHKRGGGFTLVELLTVVAIIGLLVGMVVPTIRAVIESQNTMKMRVRIRALDDGCGIYKMSAKGNKYYPGQDATEVNWLTNGSYANQGSALLARCLFWNPDGNDPYNLSKGQFPVTRYGTYSRDMLGTVLFQPDRTSVTLPALIDFNNEPMAILYYPSRVSMKGNKTQFVIADNSKYVTSSNVGLNSGTPYTIQTYVQDSSQSIVRNDGTFVISAPGMKRLYFDTDAVTNFYTN